MLDTAADRTQVDDQAAVEVASETAPQPAWVETEDLVVADLLVEDVSIDGMCGVY